MCSPSISPLTLRALQACIELKTLLGEHLCLKGHSGGAILFDLHTTNVPTHHHIFADPILLSHRANISRRRLTKRTRPVSASPIRSAMASSLRDSFNSLSWSRREEAPIHTSQQSGLMSSIRSLNPFNDRGYVQLPTTESSGAPLPAPTRREEEEGWFALSRWDRLLVFAACNLAALACFVICFTLFPVLSLRPRKFVILWSVGSALFLASFAAIMGPMNYVYHLLSAPRLPFTTAYFGSITLTLVFAIKLQSTILTLFSAIVQIACLIWYLISYFPMGSTGLRFATTFGARQATAWMTG
ncbi:hypothetical protein N3K66_005425 [Trichothecium roseum]|uniref:Uncharacterized protein n=1 Tax=Trichothecium roseum TaxID=47278 RepID=A0ACC0UXV8_9HYPO|nr:hypothetical protein N3K66_005425 [Trichothecium roseum]